MGNNVHLRRFQAFPTSITEVSHFSSEISVFLTDGWQH